MIHDFDPQLQKVFHDMYGSIPRTNWKSWLSISSGEEYECTALELSGLSDNWSEQMKKETTEPRSLSVDVDSIIESHDGPLVFSHTSGTSGGHISDLKWFHMSDSLVRRLWAPGMQAIFEGSGLNTQSSAVIFVPSRTQFDGLSERNGKEVVRVYSAEFSQRVVLSVVNPRSYSLYEYKKANTVEVIAQLLAMDRIAVVSAPSSTVLGWASLERLRKGLEKSVKVQSEYEPECSELISRIKRKGVHAVARKVQSQLSEVLKEATIIFSTTSITEKEWSTLRTFMQWKKGEEKFTNLYVGSEIGPFAASIGTGNSCMQVFPLTIAIVEKNGRRDFISQTGEKVGNLLISRTDGVNPVININTGDVITVEDQEGLPIIGEEVLRAQFPLKTRISISPEIAAPKGRIIVGSYFDINGIEIRNPRKLWACLADQCNIDGLLYGLMKSEGDTWVLAVPVPHNECSPTDIENGLLSCPGGESLGKALKKGQLYIEMVEKDLVDWIIPRSELLEKVRKGELPKGVLKKWPLYVVNPPESNL
ncbi:MAG: hypothetical protein HXS44_11310 [Theionarchaea archaeon]|nr:hypothetical protein [Theionarchaea archaeon]